MTGIGIWLQDMLRKESRHNDPTGLRFAVTDLTYRGLKG